MERLCANRENTLGYLWIAELVARLDEGHCCPKERLARSGFRNERINVETPQLRTFLSSFNSTSVCFWSFFSLILRKESLNMSRRPRFTTCQLSQFGESLRSSPLSTYCWGLVVACFMSKWMDLSLTITRTLISMIQICDFWFKSWNPISLQGCDW